MSSVFESTAGIKAGEINLLLQGLVVGVSAIFIILIILGSLKRLRAEEGYTPVNVVIDVGSAVGILSIVMLLMR